METNIKTKENNNSKQTQKETTTEYVYSKTVLSIRRKHLKPTLPGEEVVGKKLKIGSAFSKKGQTLTPFTSFEEEEKYMPEIIDVNPSDVSFRALSKDYWNNISRNVPHDDESFDSEYPGLRLEFEVRFPNKEIKKRYDNAKTFEEKRDIISEKGVEVVDNVPNFLLFAYALVYSKVANNEKDLHKSNKILFYLYSKEQEVKQKHAKLQKVKQARKAFYAIEEDNNKVDAIVRLFNGDPENEYDFPSSSDKDIFIDKKISTNPTQFLAYSRDANLLYKSLLVKAVKEGLIKNPDNTEIYYYGEENETKLGNTLDEAVAFIKRKEEVNRQIFDTLVSKLNFTPLKK